MDTTTELAGTHVTRIFFFFNMQAGEQNNNNILHRNNNFFYFFYFVTMKLTPYLTSQGGHFIPCTWHFGSSSRATSLKLPGCVDLQSHVLVIHAESHLRNQWSPTTNAPHAAWHCGGSLWPRTILESGEPKTQRS